MTSPCDPDVKWIIRAGFNVDPSTLAKNLTILCTVAFSATVLYVVYRYSNSGKRPHYTDNNIQVSFPDDEEISEDDHTTQCETRCRHSIIGSSERSKPPDSLMSFGILVEDVQSPSSRRACRLDSTVDVNLTNDRLGDSGTLVASGPNATNDIGIMDGRQDDNCLKTSGINNVETQNLPSLIKSDLNSCDVNMAAEFVVDGNLTGMTGTESSCPQTPPSTTNTASGPDVIESSCTQTPPSTTNTASGPDAIESSCTQTPPSTTNTASGPDVIESSYTETPPSSTSTAAVPNGTADGNRETGILDDTSLCAPARILPLSSGGALGPLPNSNFMLAGVSASDQPFGLPVFKERSEAHRDVCFMRENGDLHYDPDCTRPRVDLLRHCKESESQRRSRKELDVSDEDSPENLHSMDEDDDGSHFEGYIYGIIREKGSKSYKRRLCGGALFAKERRQGDADSSRQKMSLGENFGIRHQETCTQIGCGKTSECGSTGRSQKIVEGIRKMNFDIVLCKDKGTSTSADIYSYSSPRGACSERPLKQTNTISMKKTHHLLGKQIENCRGKGTSTSVDTFPASSTKGPWTGRTLKQTRTMPKEETRHVIDDNLGVVERCAEERREGGITIVHPQPVDPLEQTKSSLKALTETQHWSKMSLPEQYEYLGLLDSTLAAVSAEWKGNWNVTYWRHKDSAPPPKLSGLSSLCKPQGESEYSSRYTPGRLEVPAPQTSSPKCPTPDMAHSCFQGDADGTNIPSSSGHQVERYIGMNGHQHQHFAEVTCVEALQAMQERPVKRAQASHPQVKCQPSSLSTTSDNLIRSMLNNLYDESKSRRASVYPQTQNLHYEAARETLARARVRAKNSKYHCK